MGATVQQAVAALAATHRSEILALRREGVDNRVSLAAELHRLVQADVFEELEEADALVTAVVTAALAETDWSRVLSRLWI